MAVIVTLSIWIGRRDYEAGFAFVHNIVMVKLPKLSLEAVSSNSRRANTNNSFSER